MTYDEAEQHFRRAQRATLTARDGLQAAEVAVIRSQEALKDAALTELTR